MRTRILTYVSVAVAFLAMDAVWLTLSGEPLYRRHLAGLLLDDFRLAPAVLFYALYVAGIVVFAVAPARSAVGALARGAFLGLVAYGTYDLTNQATLKVWSTLVTAADLCWGAFATAIAATVGYFALWRSARPNR